MLSFSSVAEACRPDPPSPAGVNFFLSESDLSYSSQNFDSDKEIAVIRMLSDNVKYEILKLRAVMDPISDAKKTIPSGTYAGRD